MLVLNLYLLKGGGNMSLLVWLPLNGNYHNQGLSPDLNFVETGTVSDSNNGKIGKCKTFSLSNSISPYTFTLGSEASFCVWVNWTSLPASSSNDWIFDLASASGYANAVLALSVYHHTLLAICIGGANDSTYTHNFSTGVWYHIAVTWDGSITKLYINGELKNTYTNLNNGTVKTSNKFSLGSNVIGSSTKLRGSLNDVRIYDHCLSPKEVHEIAKGLVLHYKLDQDPLFGKNLLPTDMQRDNETGFRPSREYVNLFDYKSIIDTYGLVPYTVSFDAKSAIDHSFNLYWDYSTGSKYSFPRTSINLTTEWQRFTYTFTPAINNASGTWAGMSIYGTYGSGAIPTFRRVKLELGRIATPMDYDPTVVVDVSGCGNDGVITGDIVSASDSPRYESCTEFNGTNNSIVNSVGCVPAGTGEPCTFSIWANFSKFGVHLLDCRNSSGSGYQPILVTATGVQMGSNRGFPTINYSFSTNTWYHIVVVYEIGKNILYINGNKIGESTTGGGAYNFGTNLPLYLGCRYTSANWFGGNISDLRIYSTALSAEDIKELYDTSAFIDNGYNVETYEFVEDSDETITKTGIVKSDRFDEVEFYDYLENTGTSYIDTGYNIGPGNSKNIKMYIDYTATTNHVGNRWWTHGIGGSGGKLTVYAGIGDGQAGTNVQFTYGNGTADMRTGVYGDIGTRYIYELDLKNKTYVVKDINDNKLVNLSNLTVNTVKNTYSPYLFAWRNGSTGNLGYSHSGKIYRYKLYDNNILVRDMIPCKYNNVAGMWDRVEGKFYGNDGTGTFTLGDRVDSVSIYSDNLEANQLIEI